MMQLRALEALVEVNRCGGFTLAAARLGTTQSTVSKLIRQLEDDLGPRLLQRTNRHCRLTDAGQIVLLHAQAMLQNAANLRAELAELEGSRRGELRIGVPPLGPRLFVGLIRAFKLRHPDIELKFFEDGTRAIETALLEGRLELGGLMAPLDEARFEHLMLIDDRLALLAPARSRWSRHPTVRLSELADEPMLMFLEPYLLNQSIEAACARCGFTPKVVGRSGQIGFILELVRSGVGIALLPASELAALQASEFAVSALVEPQIEWRIDLAWLRGAYLSRAARNWIDIVDQERGSAAGSTPSRQAGNG
jgi:DNA-binding transcriptional LysR family regulator